MKILPFNYKELSKIVADIPTPFYIYDEHTIRENIRKLKQAFAWNQGFREYFAVKATPNPAILKIIKDEGCGLDCASLTELMLAEASGLSGQDIIFTSYGTPAEEYIKARTLEAIINLDDIMHIDFLAKHIKMPDIICCRYNPGGNLRLGSLDIGNPAASKFGMTKAQLVAGIKSLMSLGVKRFGIHSQLVGHRMEAQYFCSHARMLFELIVEINKETNAQIAFVDIGGGIGIPLTPDKEPVDLELIGHGVKQAYDTIIRPAGLDDIAIFTECGNFITGNAGYLVSRVIHVKKTYKQYINLDASATHFMRPAMYNEYHQITVAGKEDRSCDETYDVTGRLCENRDKFAIDRLLPQVVPGDLLVFHDAGAYGYSQGYNFNGQLRPAELFFSTDRSVHIIRRAETPDDYFATLSLNDN